MTGKNTVNHCFIPGNYDLFAGLDVSKANVSVTFLDHREMVKSMCVPNCADNLLGYVRKHFPDKRVAFAYEAGPTGYGFYDYLTTQGYFCLVAAPSMIPTPPGLQVKTNRLDSKKIAENLRGGQLQNIYVPSPIYRELRHLVQLRDAYVRQVIATKLRIKSLLLFEAIPFPEILGNSWTNASLAKLKVLPCSQVVRFKLDQLLSTLEFLHKKNLETTREIRRFCHQDPAIERNIKLLRSIPGIGWITSSQLLARIGDPNYLRHVRQIAAFLGVVPRENSTGEVIHRGSITRMGNSSPRNKLIQSAWVSIRIDPELRQFYERIRGRHPKNQASGKAIVAVARKLTTRIFSVLHEQRPYVIRHPKINNPLTQEETVPRERLEVKSEKT